MRGRHAGRSGRETGTETSVPVLVFELSAKRRYQFGWYQS